MVYKPSSYSLLVYQVYLFDLQACSDPHCTYCTYCIRHYTSSTYRTLSEHYTPHTYRTLYVSYVSNIIRLVRIWLWFLQAVGLMVSYIRSPATFWGRRSHPLASYPG